MRLTNEYPSGDNPLHDVARQPLVLAPGLPEPGVAARLTEQPNRAKPRALGARGSVFPETLTRQEG